MNITYTYFQTTNAVNPYFCSLIQVLTRFVFVLEEETNYGTGNSFRPPLSTQSQHMCGTFKGRVSAPLRGVGVSFVGLSMLFEYTVVERGWSRITSDVFRSVSRAHLDAAFV